MHSEKNSRKKGQVQLQKKVMISEPKLWMHLTYAQQILAIDCINLGPGKTNT